MKSLHFNARIENNIFPLRSSYERKKKLCKYEITLTVRFFQGLFTFKRQEMANLGISSRDFLFTKRYKNRMCAEEPHSLKMANVARARIK